MVLFLGRDLTVSGGAQVLGGRGDVEEVGDSGASVPTPWHFGAVSPACALHVWSATFLSYICRSRKNSFFCITSASPKVFCFACGPPKKVCASQPPCDPPNEWVPFSRPGPTTTPRHMEWASAFLRHASPSLTIPNASVKLSSCISSIDCMAVQHRRADSGERPVPFKFFKLNYLGVQFHVQRRKAFFCCR